MKNFLTLVKFQFRSQYGISLLKSSFTSENKKPLKAIGLGLIILIALVQMIGLYSIILWQIFSAAKTLGIPELILTFGAVITGLFILVFGTFYILGGIFFAKDSEFLSTLPVKQQTVFASKFALVLIGEYPFVLAVLIPPILIYGINMNSGFGYYFLAFVCGLIIPLIPLSISAFFSLILMKIVSRIRHRDLFVSIAGMVVFVGIFLGNNLIVSKFAVNDSGGMMNQVVNSIKGIITLVGRGFPPAIWITNILTLSGLNLFVNISLLILVSAVCLIIVLFLASFIYQKGAQAQFEAIKSVSKKVIKFSSTKPVFSVCKNEFKMIMRTPMFALNSFSGWLMGPLIVAIPFFNGSLHDPKLKQMLLSIQEDNKALVFLIVTALLVFFALINPSPSSAISREGSGFWLLRSCPILPRTYVLGKLICDYFISVGSVVIGGIALIIVLKMDGIMAIFAIILAMLIAYPITIAGILIDVIRPKLVWSNPQEVIKQNLNVLLAMLLGLIIAGIFGVVAFFMLTANFDVYVIALLESFLAVIMSMVLQSVLFKMADKKFS